MIKEWIDGIPESIGEKYGGGLIGSLLEWNQTPEGQDAMKQIAAMMNGQDPMLNRVMNQPVYIPDDDYEEDGFDKFLRQYNDAKLPHEV